LFTVLSGEASGDGRPVTPPLRTALHSTSKCRDCQPVEGPVAGFGVQDRPL